MTNLDRILKSREITLRTIVYNQSYGFSGSHVQMWELNHKEGWVPKNWWFQTVMLENTLENPLNSKDIKPVNPKGHQPWIFIGKTDAEAPIFWSPDGKSQLIGKDPDAGKDWGQEEKGAAEDEMVGQHHRPVHWKHRMLTNGLPGKSQFVAFCDHTTERLLAVFDNPWSNLERPRLMKHSAWLLGQKINRGFPGGSVNPSTNAGDKFYPWSRKIPTCRAATKPGRHDSWALYCRTWEPQLLKPVCLESALCRKRSQGSENPTHHS